MLILNLFGTTGCHLCDDAVLILSSFDYITIEYIDIAEQIQWQAKYSVLIPVLYHAESGNELFWPFNYDDVNVFSKRLIHD